MLATILSLTLAAAFVALGTAKLLAVPDMRARAAHVGFSVNAYRGIGALEVSGAVGLAVGLAVPSLGLAAAAGLVLLMVGALVTHVRLGDRPQELAPAAVIGLLAVTCAALLAQSI